MRYLIVNFINKLVVKILFVISLVLFPWQHTMSNEYENDCQVEIKIFNPSYTQESLPEIGILYSPNKQGERSFDINMNIEKVICKNPIVLDKKNKCVQSMLQHAILYLENQKLISRKNIQLYPEKDINAIGEGTDEFEYFIPLKIILEKEKEFKNDILRYSKTYEYILNVNIRAYEISLSFAYESQGISIPNMLIGIFIVNNGKNIYTNVFDTMEKYVFFKSNQKLYFINSFSFSGEEQVGLTSYEIMSDELKPIATISCDYTKSINRR